MLAAESNTMKSSRDCLRSKGLREGRAVAQAVSRRPLTAEVRLRTRVNRRGESGIGTGFSPKVNVKLSR
jgi:hypothetical protein